MYIWRNWRDLRRSDCLHITWHCSLVERNFAIRNNIHWNYNFKLMFSQIKVNDLYGHVKHFCWKECHLTRVVQPGNIMKEPGKQHQFIMGKINCPLQLLKSFKSMNAVWYIFLLSHRMDFDKMLNQLEKNNCTNFWYVYVEGFHICGRAGDKM